jgi:hypothetical protein
VKKLLGEVQLRRTYAVYEEGGTYTVASESPRGQRYECTVVPEAVVYLCDRAAGQRLTSSRAGAILEPVAEEFSLPYTYGERLRFSGQYVLIAAVALGRATVAKEGRSYVYSVDSGVRKPSAEGDAERAVQASIAPLPGLGLSGFSRGSCTRSRTVAGWFTRSIRGTVSALPTSPKTSGLSPPASTRQP